LATDVLVCISTTTAHPPSSGEGLTGESVVHYGGPGESISPVDPRAGHFLVCGTIAGSRQGRRTVAGPQIGSPPARFAGGPWDVHFFSLRSKAFPKWCDSNDVIPSRCEAGKMLSFLQSLLEKGLAFSTIKVYAVAESAGHVGCDGVSVFSHPLVKRFLRGARYKCLWHQHSYLT